MKLNRGGVRIKGVAGSAMERGCLVPECDREHGSLGYCASHYQRVRRYGTPLGGRRFRGQIAQVCQSPEGCDRRAKARDLCEMHYQRVYRVKVTQPRIVQQVGNATTAHARVTRLLGSASSYPCIECGEQARDWAYDGTDPVEQYKEHPANPGSWQRYSSWPEFYMPMCRTCHSARDKAYAKRELKVLRLYLRATGLTLDDLEIKILETR